MIDIGCKDNKCIFGNKNPGTNRGCRCLDGIHGETRRNLRSKILLLREEVERLEKEVKHLLKVKEYFWEHSDFCCACAYEDGLCELHQMQVDYENRFCKDVV